MLWWRRGHKGTTAKTHPVDSAACRVVITDGIVLQLVVIEDADIADTILQP